MTLTEELAGQEIRSAANEICIFRELLQQAKDAQARASIARNRAIERLEIVQKLGFFQDKFIAISLEESQGEDTGKMVKDLKDLLEYKERF
jgi:hypothetical protein